MNRESIKKAIKSILLVDFSVNEDQFYWDKELEHLQEEFNILGIFLKLEEALSNYFNIDIPLIEHINPSFHTPDDIVELLQRLLQDP